MALYALVKDGEILEYREYSSPPLGDQSRLAAGKAKVLPVVEANGAYDPVSQAREGPTIEVGKARVTRTYTVRAKNSGELDAMRASKFDDMEVVFQELVQAPIEFAVGGQTYTWHADQEAVRNITGVVLLIVAGVPVPNPRTWTPVGSTDPVSITHAELLGLGLAIAARKDALFVKKKQKQVEVNALNNGADIEAYDVNAGWA